MVGTSGALTKPNLPRQNGSAILPSENKYHGHKHTLRIIYLQPPFSTALHIHSRSATRYNRALVHLDLPMGVMLVSSVFVFRALKILRATHPQTLINAIPFSFLMCIS